MTRTTHSCPHCTCPWEPVPMTRFDRNAPFAPLVIAIDTLTFEQQYSRKPGSRGDLYGIDVHSIIPGEIPVVHRTCGLPTAGEPTPSATLVTMNEGDT